MRKYRILFAALFLFLFAPYFASASGGRPTDKQEAELKKVPASVVPFGNARGKVRAPLPLQLRDVGEKCDCPMDEGVKALENK